MGDPGFIFIFLLLSILSDSDVSISVIEYEATIAYTRFSSLPSVSFDVGQFDLHLAGCYDFTNRMASIREDPGGKFQFGCCAYRLSNGKRTFRLTKLRDRIGRGKLSKVRICIAWAQGGATHQGVGIHRRFGYVLLPSRVRVVWDRHQRASGTSSVPARRGQWAERGNHLAVSRAEMGACRHYWVRFCVGRAESAWGLPTGTYRQVTPDVPGRALRGGTATRVGSTRLFTAA